MVSMTQPPTPAPSATRSLPRSDRAFSESIATRPAKILWNYVVPLLDWRAVHRLSRDPGTVGRFRRAGAGGGGHPALLSASDPAADRRYRLFLAAGRGADCDLHRHGVGAAILYRV